MGAASKIAIGFPVVLIAESEKTMRKHASRVMIPESIRRRARALLYSLTFVERIVRGKRVEIEDGEIAMLEKPLSSSNPSRSLYESSKIL